MTETVARRLRRRRLSRVGTSMHTSSRGEGRNEINAYMYVRKIGIVALCFSRFCENYVRNERSFC